MAKIRVRKETGRLYIDFVFRGQRCREQSLLDDTPANRKRLERLLARIQAEIQAGTFDYLRYFPYSKRAAQAEHAAKKTAPVASAVALVLPSVNTMPDPAILPTFKTFAEIWFVEMEIGWRKSHRRTIRDILDKRLIPEFGGKLVGQITKADILAFRSSLAKLPGRKHSSLTAKSVNAIVTPLRQILNEAADRFEYTTPFRNIKPLRVQKTDVEPFTLDEVQKIIDGVRADFRNYYTVRFFTGMRTGEIDGLKWKYVDFSNQMILVRESIVAGEQGDTKTDGSLREIRMGSLVFDALMDQAKISRGKSDYVFCNRNGEPFDHNNVTKRVWYPLLRFLGLKPRRPYQSRHTAATLWLASGENPLWIARQLGHTSTEMLFKVYGRFVPNLTRQDGSAFERLLLQSGVLNSVGSDATAANEPLLEGGEAPGDDSVQDTEEGTHG